MNLVIVYLSSLLLSLITLKIGNVISNNELFPTKAVLFLSFIPVANITVVGMNILFILIYLLIETTIPSRLNTLLDKTTRLFEK